jgi:hypothetical protein
MIPRVLSVSCFCIGVALPQAQTDDLAKIQTAVEENLSRLPNYTCIESIEQSERFPIEGKLKVTFLEKTRMEVAFVEGKELFGWPGAAKIDQSDVAKMIKGSIGNGYFGLFSKTIFQVPSTTFQYVNATELEGKPAVRYNYRVPQLTGAYFIKTGVSSAVVGFHGSFWADPVTHDLMRVTVLADDIPPLLGIASTSSLLDFDRQRIGSSTFVLPRSAQLVVTDADGPEKEVRLSFARCHQFVGESELKFEDPTAESLAAKVSGPIQYVVLPDKFKVDFNLDTAIDWSSSASGDPVHGTLREAVRLNGEIVAPKGARLSGRIAHLAMRDDSYSVELHLTSLDFAGGQADLTGRQNMVVANGVPLIYRSAKFKLRSGVRLTLHSRLLKSVHNDSIRH